jgi:hypothetical protein
MYGFAPPFGFAPHPDLPAVVFGLPIDIVSSTLDSLGIQEIAGLEAKASSNDYLHPARDV